MKEQTFICENGEQLTITVPDEITRDDLTNMRDMMDSIIKSYQKKLENTSYLCMNCGKEVEQIPGRKEKKFCNSSCRTSYWLKHRKETQADYEYICPKCNSPFKAYGNTKRVYCSQKCYFAARYSEKQAEKVFIDEPSLYSLIKQFGLNRNTVKSYKSRNPQLSNYEVLQHFCPNLSVNIFGELVV